MARDTKNKKTTSKEQQIRRSKRIDELNRKKKNNQDSDSSDSENSNSSDTENDENNEEEMDTHEYRKFLSKIFPSKHLNQKIKAGDKLKKTLKKDIELESDDSDEDESEVVVEEKKRPKKSVNKKSSQKNKKSSQKNKNKKEEEEEESEWEDEEDSDEEENDEDYIEDKKFKQKGSGKLNIIFTIGGANNEFDEEYSDEDYSDETDDAETEDEDESVSSVESSNDTEDKEIETTKKDTKKKTKKEKIEKPDTKNKNSVEEMTIDDINKVLEERVKIEKEKEEHKHDIETNDIETNDQELLNKIKELCEQNRENKKMQKCLEVFEEDIKKSQKKKEKKDKKVKDKNARIFKKIVKDKNTMNDYAFFDTLLIPEQKKIIKELKEINKITRVEIPYRISLLDANMPVGFKAAAIKKINSLRYMEPGSGEYYKIKNWVDTFMRIPFGINQNLEVNITDGVEKCHDFMENAQNILNSAVYGLNDAKMQIMQMLGQLITNPKAIGSAIAIKGPMGTGKTTLVKEGISKILNRPFAFIALGGATDSSFLEGHGYTYEGSTWGKIVQILIDSKCMNPVIYFDELDKISDTPKGEEIAGILTHLTDTSQNNQFHDKYFAEIDFDLSKCLFIFSYNDESKVNPILRDRMYRIQTKGYSQKQKIIISNDYLLPKIREQVMFENKDIIIPDDSLQYIIENHCNKEDGVRNLKRCLEIIYTKLNLYRLMKPGSNLFEEDMSLLVEFPFTVTKTMVDKLIKNDKDNFSAMHSMYV